jgi:predicted lactoylglutathione lyase
LEIKIGLRNVPREIVFESEQSSQEVEQTVANAMESGAKVIKLVDNKGKLFLVPIDALGYIEVGAEEVRRVGFIA